MVGSSVSLGAGSQPDGRWSRAVAGHTFADSLHGADLRPVLHGVNAKVDLGERLLLLDCTDGIVDLQVLNPAPLGDHHVVLGVHGGVVGLSRESVWEEGDGITGRGVRSLPAPLVCWLVGWSGGRLGVVSTQGYPLCPVASEMG